MNPLNNQTLGIAFVGIAAVMTLLMYRAWAFPYDKATHKSAAPKWLGWSHRLLGYTYLAIYLYLMWDMVPRLWTYQIELPARTVAHLMIGMSIAGLLLVKLTIVRFFKHMEAKLVPILGTALFLCSFLLVSLALPVQVRESYLRDAAVMDGRFSEERLARVLEQLPKAGLEDPQAVQMLASTEGLLNGRDVLKDKCVQCHDLRTVLARPRTPEAWRRTVARMAERSTVLNAISEEEQWQVTAYLIAVSPTLQETLKQKRALVSTASASRSAVNTASATVMNSSQDAQPLDTNAAKVLFEAKCSQCHAFEQVETIDLPTMQSAADLITRMVRNGLAATDAELELIIRYVSATYVKAEQVATPGTESARRNSTTDVPASGSARDSVVVIRPLGEDLQFENEELTVTSGTRIQFELDNTASQEHNFVLLELDADIDAVVDASYDAVDQGYVPKHPAVLAGIGAVSAGGTGSATLVAPAPGQYRFVCLMPGHSFTMRGILHVVEP